MSNNVKRASDQPPSESTPAHIDRDNVEVGGYRLPFKVLQEIYEELTEKPQSTGRYYTDPVRIKFDDIEQLNIKFAQTCKQYNVKTFNTTFTVFYLNDSRNEFDNFADFMKLSAASSSAVESVLIKYNLLLTEPDSNKPQSYNVSIRLISQLVTRKRFEQNFVGAPPSLIRLAGFTKTVDVEVRYVDYSVARSILALIEDWHKVLKQAPNSKNVRILQEKSHWIPRGVKVVTGIFVTYLAAAKLPILLHDKTDLTSFGQIFAWSALGIFLAYTFAGWFARTIEMAIDRWSPLAYINLGKGDENEIQAAEDANRKHIIKIIWGVAGSIAVGVLCNLIADYISR